MAYNFKKSEILKSIKGSKANVSVIANRLNVDWMTAKKYIEKYNLTGALNNEKETEIDRKELKMDEMIFQQNNQYLLKYWLDTHAKHRGYGQDKDINVKIQPYNPNSITFEQRQELINQSINLLVETTANSINNAIETDYILENEN